MGKTITYEECINQIINVFEKTDYYDDVRRELPAYICAMAIVRLNELCTDGSVNDRIVSELQEKAIGFIDKDDFFERLRIYRLIINGASTRNLFLSYSLKRYDTNMYHKVTKAFIDFIYDKFCGDRYIDTTEVYESHACCDISELIVIFQQVSVYAICDFLNGLVVPKKFLSKDVKYIEPSDCMAFLNIKCDISSIVQTKIDKKSSAKLKGRVHINVKAVLYSLAWIVIFFSFEKTLSLLFDTLLGYVYLISGVSVVNIFVYSISRVFIAVMSCIGTCLISKYITKDDRVRKNSLVFTGAILIVLSIVLVAIDLSSILTLSGSITKLVIGLFLIISNM